MSSEKNNILEFNQYIKSSKMTYNIYANIQSLILKQMNVKTIAKTLRQQKYVDILFADIQCQEFEHLMT